MASILRVRATISFQLTSALSTVYWRPGTAGGSVADATDCLARVRAAWLAFAARIPNGSTVSLNPNCEVLEDSTGILTAVFQGATPANVAGTGAGDILPNQTQGLARLGTSLIIGGRLLKGRLFLPFPLESDNTGQIPSGAYTGAVATAFGGMLTGGGTASFPVVWHRPGAGGAGSSGAVASVVGAGTWSVLRSRR